MSTSPGGGLSSIGSYSPIKYQAPVGVTMLNATLNSRRKGHSGVVTLASSFDGQNSVESMRVLKFKLVRLYEIMRVDVLKGS
jgi:hypothetical protein